MMMKDFHFHKNKEEQPQTYVQRQRHFDRILKSQNSICHQLDSFPSEEFCYMKNRKILNNVTYLRVHDVAANRDALEVAWKTCVV